MKKTIWIFLIMSSSMTAMAQKGSWYIGGVAGFGSNNFKSASGNKSGTSFWAFGPEGGTFLKDDIQLGLALGLSGSTSKNNGNDTESVTNISPTVYMRKFYKITDNFSAFAGFYLSYYSGKTIDHTVTPAEESKQTGFGLRLGVGIAYALSPRFTAVGQYGLLGYTSLNNKVGGNDAGSDSSFSFGANTVGSSTLSQGNGSGAVFNVGLYYTLKKP